MKNIVYSIQTINEALDADNQEGRLHRDILTVEDMEESEFGRTEYELDKEESEYEQFKNEHNFSIKEADL